MGMELLILLKNSYFIDVLEDIPISMIATLRTHFHFNLNKKREL